MNDKSDYIKKIFLCEDEYKTLQKDVYGRVIPDLSNEYIHNPVVSQYLFEKGFSPIYPENKKFAVCISHDVDRLFEEKWKTKTLVKQQAIALVKFQFGKLSDNLKNLNRRIYPRHHLKNTLLIGDKYGVKSSFYFLSLNQNEEDFNYLTKEIKPLFNLLKQNNHEIGLHGGHNAFKDKVKLATEKLNLESDSDVSVIGYRGHYLKFDISKTWQNLIEAGFKYDTTFGFAQTIGFRNGMCYPFMARDKDQNLLKMAVIPLQVMDETLFNYLKLDYKQAYDLCINLFEKVISVNGVISLLWHNNYMFGERGKFYDSLLKYLNDRNGWFVNGKDVVNYYESKKYFAEQNRILDLK